MDSDRLGTPIAVAESGSSTRNEVRRDRGAPLPRLTVFRWVLLAGTVLFLLALSAYVIKTPALYLSWVQVRFVYPPSKDDPNALRIRSSSLVITAGAISKMINGASSLQAVSPDTTLANDGVKHGYSVTLPNSGGQWSSSFASPWLDVQVVGTTLDEVQTVTQRLLGQINSNLDEVQRSLGVDQYNLIHTELSPPSGPQLYAPRGSSIRAAAGLLVLGIGGLVTAWRLVRRRTWRPSGAPQVIMRADGTV